MATIWTAQLLDTYLRKNSAGEVSNWPRMEHRLRDGRIFWFKRAEMRNQELAYEVGWEVKV